jgi:hypothetical protein
MRTMRSCSNEMLRVGCSRRRYYLNNNPICSTQFLILFAFHNSKILYLLINRNKKNDAEVLHTIPFCSIIINSLFIFHKTYDFLLPSTYNSLNKHGINIIEP